MRQMSNMGVTTVEGKSGYGLDKETELLQLKVMRSLNNDEHKRVDIVSTFLGAHAVPEEYKGRTDEYLDFIISDVLPCVAKTNWPSFVMSSANKVFSLSNNLAVCCKLPRNMVWA